VSPKLIRLMFAATMVAGFSAPMLGASAAGRTSSVDALSDRFEVPTKAEYEPLEISKDDTVRWNIVEGEHTVTAKDRNQWGGTGSPGKLTPTSDPYTKKFTTPGKYFYFCEIHGGRDEDDNLTGMWGVIQVIDPTPNTQPPPPPPPPTTAPPETTTTTTRPGATPPATSATAPTTRPAPVAPAPTTTTAKPDKKKDAKEEETTTTSSTLPPPVDLPNEAIVPTLPGSGAAPGSDAEAPIDTPEGEAVALLKSKKDKGGDAVKLLIVSGLGLGALGVGTAGYKYANRSSKYFPA
jgi:plastocyanin